MHESPWSKDGRVVGGPGLPGPRTQLDKYQIILKTQEINLTTDKTNCRSRGREEATLWKAGGGGTGFGGGEMDSR